jgi:hypothetical protein
VTVLADGSAVLPPLAGVLLAAGTWWGYRTFASRYAARTAADGSLQKQGLVLVLVLTLMVGIGVPLWWADAEDSFTWDLPPLASRMLAAAALAFAVLGGLVLRRPTRRRVRLVLLMLAVYLAPLVAVILLFHLDRFDFGEPITYGFFALAATLTTASLWYLVCQPELVAEEGRDQVQSGTAARLALGAVVALTAPWGAALFVTDDGGWDLVWAWPGDALSSRLIGVMLLTIAAGGAFAWPRADTARLALVTTGLYAVGVVAASAWAAVDDVPVKRGYLGAFAAVAVVCATASLRVGARTHR